MSRTILRISAKCSDLYYHQIIGKDGKLYREYQGYVPSFFPNSYSGNDYIELDIDPYTGEILNWKNWKPSKKSKELTNVK